jgi:hypothetical protein
MYVVVIQVTEVVLFRKSGGNEVRLRHFSLRQVKSSEFNVLFFSKGIFTGVLVIKKITARNILCKQNHAVKDKKNRSGNLVAT